MVIDPQTHIHTQTNKQTRRQDWLQYTALLIYINDICKAVPDAKVKLYADDTNLFLFDADANNLNIKANTSLKELNTWFEINKLSLNIEKTCYAVFLSSPKNV